MQWIITTKEGVDLGELESRLAEWGCERREGHPIPLGEGELAMEVFGPKDLPEKARREAAHLITEVYPNSPMALY